MTRENAIEEIRIACLVSEITQGKKQQDFLFLEAGYSKTVRDTGIGHEYKVEVWILLGGVI